MNDPLPLVRYAKRKKRQPFYRRPSTKPMANAGLGIEVRVSTEQHVRGELGHPLVYIFSY